MWNTVKGYLCPDSTSAFEFSMGLVKLIRLSSLNFTYLSDTVIQCEPQMNFVMVNQQKLWNQKGLGNGEEENTEKMNRIKSRKKSTEEMGQK